MEIEAVETPAAGMATGAGSRDNRRDVSPQRGKMDHNHFIAWRADYSVGHKILDRQHQFIVHQINRL